jgi:hypothetical protein
MAERAGLFLSKSSCLFFLLSARTEPAHLCVGFFASLKMTGESTILLLGTWLF